MCSLSWFGLWLVLIVFSGGSQLSLAQTPTPSPSPSSTPTINFAKRIARDQKAIWLSPLHVKEKDLKTLAPFAVAATALILTDRHTSGWVDRFGSLPGVSH